METIKEFVERAKSGDRSAFSEIYKLFFKKIYRYCKFNLKNQDEAQDVCQETFMKAWRSIKNFNTDNENWSIQAFLFTIARNLIIDRARAKKELPIADYENIESFENLYEHVDRVAEMKTVQEALSKLEEEERQIIILRYFEEMNSREVSKILGIKDGALRVRQYRILQKLKTILEILHEKRN